MTTAAEIQDATGDPYCVAVYVAMERFADGGRTFSVPQVEIAKAAGCSRRKVHDAIVKLREAGFVTWTQIRRTPGAMNLVSTYTLTKVVVHETHNVVRLVPNVVQEAVREAHSPANPVVHEVPNIGHDALTHKESPTEILTTEEEESSSSSVDRALNLPVREGDWSPSRAQLLALANWYPHVALDLELLSARDYFAQPGVKTKLAFPQFKGWVEKADTRRRANIEKQRRVDTSADEAHLRDDAFGYTRPSREELNRLLRETM